MVFKYKYLDFVKYYFKQYSEYLKNTLKKLYLEYRKILQKVFEYFTLLQVVHCLNGCIKFKKITIDI